MRERDGAPRIQRGREQTKQGEGSRPSRTVHTPRDGIHARKEHNASSHPPSRRRTHPPQSPSSFLLPQGNGQKPRPPQNAHGASTHHPFITRQKISSQPALNGTRSPTQRSHTRCTTPAGKETRAAHSLPSPLFSWPRKKTTAATRNCQHALQKVHPNPLQCAPCVCARRNTKHKSIKEEAEYVKRRTKNLQRRCVAGATRGRLLKLMAALQLKQRQFTQYLLKTKKDFPLRLTQTPSHKIIINEKEIVHYYSTQINKRQPAAVWPHQTVCIYFACKEN
ncbi:hypothetical protein TCDM_08851 [Trypanosoma cruzi Dm28c]|uniref:Uncharacterized protein n=1 Tax=Trypanosoma cruzi Dm28c TaxID=1416333 RepID=V5B6W0_TRYCR|nr:hypothetical protein TCDM_08851 [Trypanosoma cruzi Dm28c]